MQVLVIIFILLSIVILSIFITGQIWKLFTFSVPLVPKKENNFPFYVMIVVDIILFFIIIN